MIIAVVFLHLILNLCVCIQVCIMYVGCMPMCMDSHEDQMSMSDVFLNHSSGSCIDLLFILCEGLSENLKISDWLD